MRQQDPLARQWGGTGPLIAIASVLLAACSVYDMHPDIDPYASRDRGVNYETDLKKCQDSVAGSPEASRPDVGTTAVAGAVVGGTIAGGGAALFHGNVRNAAGLGALVGTSAAFSGLAQSAGDTRTSLQICLMERGYTVVWGNGYRMPAFDPPLVN
jgi:fermentation-respiration switch protein FrsA (DUF1100 family)